MIKSKKIVAFIMIVCIVFGGINIPSSVQAATSTPLQFIDGGYNDSRQIYVINVKASKVINLETINTIDGTLLVNGVETAVKWEGYNSPTYYQILIPYTSIFAEIPNASMSASAYITIPAGTTVGNITVSENLNVRLVCGGMTSKDFIMEVVDEVPENYFYQRWNYNADNLYIYFKKTDAIAEGWIAEQATVYVDGTPVSVQWEGDKNEYYFPIAYSHFGATSLSDIGSHVLWIPQGTTVG